MTLRRVFAILAAGLLFLAACGDDDDSDDSAATTTEAPADNNDDTGDTGDGDVDLPSGFSSEDCEQFAEALSGAAAALTGATDYSELAGFYEEVADRVPEEIRDDFDVVAEAVRDFAEAAEDAGIDFTDPETLTPAALQQVAEESERFNEGEFQEASENLDEWRAENCGG
jgi:hypothetical protein